MFLACVQPAAQLIKTRLFQVVVLHWVVLFCGQDSSNKARGGVLAGYFVTDEITPVVDSYSLRC